ncbi:MAG TPA: protein translocase subunit SecF [Terracidiphilus sp.]
MELFRGVNVDWLRLKWYFLSFSLIFSVAGLISMGMHMRTIGSPVPLGVDFKGGTQVQVQFDQTPDTNRIRQAMAAASIKDASIQTIKAVDQSSGNEVLISLPEQQDESALDTGRQQIMDALQKHYDSTIGPRNVRNTQVVGPTVGKQLESKAFWATMYSMAGMLVYLWFRFEFIFGVAAVVACFHDTLITVGAFALLNKEISLTVIAAILTLVGYSMNDTIVVFDRIRENLRLSRREALPDVVNRSINQTLSRTVLTSGLTFLTVLSLYIFGGQVLNGFSFALVVGILIGTYSSIAIAAPMLVAWQTKNKVGAVVMAVLFGLWTWSYTYEKDARKFWISFACGIFLLAPLRYFGEAGAIVSGLGALVIWVWAIVDAVRRPEEFYTGLHQSVLGRTSSSSKAKGAFKG